MIVARFLKKAWDKVLEKPSDKDPKNLAARFLEQDDTTDWYKLVNGNLGQCVPIFLVAISCPVHWGNLVTLKSGERSTSQDGNIA